MKYKFLLWLNTESGAKRLKIKYYSTTTVLSMWEWCKST